MNTSDRPELSIIIVNWKSKDFLRRCLETIRETSSGMRLEIIVVDNASFDGSDALVRDEFPQVRFFQSEKNLGFSGANNLGFELSTGRNLLFLNPDTEVLGTAIGRLVSALEEAPQRGVVGPKLLNSDLTLQTTCVQAFPSILNQVLDAEWLRERYPRWGIYGTRAIVEEQPGPVPVDMVSGACLMIRRDLFAEVQEFSTDYFMYSEDVDLCYKARRAGKTVSYVSEARVIHHGGKSSGANPISNFATVMMRQSRLRYFRKWRGPAYARAYQLAMALVAAGRMMLLGTALLAPVGASRRKRLGYSLAKWVSVLRWAAGMEDWSKSSL